MPWSRDKIVINKKKKYFSLPDHQPAEKFDSCFWILPKDENRMKINVYLDLTESQFKLVPDWFSKVILITFKFF